MPSIVPGYEYDIFISYRQNDNRSDQWVTKFIQSLKEELDAAFKEDISIYFDKNPHDGLRESHDVDDSLAKKLKCLIFIPIISKTYCDPNTFAWKNEFLAFNKLAENDEYGLKIALPNGNTASRILPIRIHDIEDADRQLVENEIGFLRSIDFVYKEPGVNRPLRPDDSEEKNLESTKYRNQINKVANAIQEIISGIKTAEATDESDSDESGIPPPKKTQLTSELKRRNVLRTSLVYTLTALAIWKGAGVIGLPQNMLQIVPFILIILFPISILMAWLYERSPQGFIKTGSAASRNNPFTDAQKKPLTSNTFILLLVATVVALFLIYPQAQRTKLSEEITELEKSIAVIPFENLSNKEEQEYFSEGITDVIISQLAKVGDFRVLSRTSTLKYKDHKLTASEIANALNVNFIVEGSVQRQGDDLRIAVQLIRANNEDHLWAELYDRKWEDIFFIQSDVAKQIANQLQTVLSPEEINEIEIRPTENLEAYNLYIQGKYYWNKRTEDGFINAARLFEQSIALDSSFVEAYSGLAETYLVSFHYPVDFNQFIYPEKAKALIDKGLKLDPNSAEIIADLAFYYQHYKGDNITAQKYYEESIKLDPDYPTARHWYSICLNIMGDYENALVQAKKALEIEPDTPLGRWAYGRTLSFLGRVDEARDYIEAAINEFPDFNQLHQIMGTIESLAGNLEDALNNFQKAADQGLVRGHFSIVGTYLDSDQLDLAREYLNELDIEIKNTNPTWVSRVYFHMGEIDQAIHFLNVAYEQHKRYGKLDELASDLINNNRYDDYRSIPEFQVFVEKLNFPSVK